MILTTHMLAGAVIGKNIDSLWLIIPTALLTHFVLDALPHGEYIYSPKKTLTLKEKIQRIFLDLFFGLLLVFFLIYSKDLNASEIRNILLGAFFSIFPDFFTVLNMKFESRALEKIHKFHYWVHSASRKLKNNYWNLPNAKNDILLSIIAIIILFS